MRKYYNFIFFKLIMNKKPLISVCIPAYRWKTISDALNSIVKQFDWKIDNKIEIIVCDDDSPDWIKNIIQKDFLDKYKNIKYYKHEKNMWLQYNLADSTSFATWEYLRLLCDDDCLTSFSLKHTIEIINKTNFDLLLANWKFSPSVKDTIKEWKNTYKEYTGIEPVIEYMYNERNTYQDLVVYFQFYSTIVVKNSYRRESLSKFDKDFVYDNIFPQDIIIYSHLKGKKIIIPDEIFVLWRTMNESYKATNKYVTDFKVEMDIIEEKNWLRNNKKWKILKRRVVSWRTKTIYLWMILRFFHIDYKNNKFFKKLYFFYKKYIQNQVA